jgi:Transcriptional regulators
MYTVAKFVLQNPGVTSKEIAEALELPRGKVSRHLVKCEQSGWIRVVDHKHERGAPTLVWGPCEAT